jgi:pimeloyl-ACP methyl ester carboxylesterase
MPSFEFSLRHVILVHGAWQGPWAWDGVRALWSDSGVELHAVELPTVRGGGDLYGDALAVVELAASLEPDIGLFGHSYGGAVVTQAAAGIPGLRAVGFLAAVRPDVGESTADVSRRLGERTSLDDAITRVDSDLELAPEAISSVFENPAGQRARRAMRRSHPQSVASFRQSVTHAIPADVTTKYVVCRDDLAVSVRLQRATATTCSSFEEINAGHCPHIEHPDLVVTTLSRFTRGS